MSTEYKLKVSEIQRFCMHDGPGIRTTVFFKGCPLKCAWCHNPENKKMQAEMLFYQSKCIGCGSCISACAEPAILTDDPKRIDRDKCLGCGSCCEVCPTGALKLCGQEMTIAEIISEVKKDGAFYGELGGITLSGGEPFAQGDGIIALLEECKKCGISTAVETSGFAAPDLIRRAAPYVDLFLWDVKDTNDSRHTEYVGASNMLCLENLMMINELGAKIELRCILVNGVNTDEDHYRSVAEIAEKINNLESVRVIPYHAYGGCKAVFIGGEDNGRVDWIPTEEQVNEFKKIISQI